MDILNKTLDSVEDIINNTTAQNLDFYSVVLEKMSSLYNKNHSISIFFFENNGCVLKKAIKNNTIIENYPLKDEIVQNLYLKDKEYYKDFSYFESYGGKNLYFVNNKWQSYINGKLQK